MILRVTQLLIFLSVSYGFAQGAANNWYFGNKAGISFETSPPSTLADGKLTTLEGCATISDENGALLFYTDGTVVYNANGEIMQNGTGLLGNSSSTQSAIIIPKPQDPDVYYVFTVDALEQIEIGGPIFTDGINYSIVDFTNNPLGEVTTKNEHLLDFSAEKLSAVLMGCDSDTVWMVTLSSPNAAIPGPNESLNLNTFYAYSINENGVNKTPVKSTLPLNITDQRGNLKFSPDGKKLACANVLSGLYLLDFNSQTGQISNPQSLGSYEIIRDAYGVEFSPNNRFLYVAAYNEQPINNPAEAFTSVLRQYDLEASNINGSATVIDRQTLYRSSLQLGPDGRIYRSMSSTYFDGLPYLSVIENPDLEGTASNYVNNAINLESGMSSQGLPPFNQSLFNRIDIIQNERSSSTLNLCEDETYTLGYENITGADYQWYKNEEPLLGETSSQLNIGLENSGFYPDKTAYKLEINLNDGTCPRVGIANVFFYPKPQQPEEDLVLSQCESAENADGFSVFNLYQVADQIPNAEAYDLNFYKGVLQATNEITNPEAYTNEKADYQEITVGISSPAGCETLFVHLYLQVGSNTTATAQLEQCDADNTGYGSFNLNSARDQLLPAENENIQIEYYSSNTAALLKDETERLSNVYENTTAFNETIYARMENDGRCYGIGMINLVVNPLPNFTLLETTTICANLSENITISPDYDLSPDENYTYSWAPTGQTTPNLVTNLPGEHTLTVTNTRTGCSRERSLRLEAQELATIENIEVIDASEKNSATITTSGAGNFEYALNENGPYQLENRFTDLQPGFYTVFVRSQLGCGTVSKDFSIIGFDKFFTPNGDGYNDRWQVKGISQMIQPGTQVRIYDRYGKLLKQLSPLSPGWDGMYNGQRLASDDYWFHVVLEDGREFRSHFTLKR